VVVIDRKYAGAAVLAHVTGSMTAGSPLGGGTFTVDDDTGYPVTGKFPVVISRGNADEEKILVASRSGATFTVSSRGYDGTSAQSHSAQATCELAFDAASLNLVVDHVDDVEADPHSTKLLNNTRHDVTARHTFGNAFATPATPAAVVANQAGSAGVAAGPPRADHVHAGPVSGTPVSVGTANAAGSGTALALANHVHDIANGSIDAAALFGAGVVDSTALGALAVTAGKIATGGVSATAQIADGIITLAKAASEASTSYVPGSFAAAGTFSLGTGGTAYGHYFKFGRILVVWVGFAMAADGNLVGTLTIPLPVAMRTAGADNQRGFAAARAQGGGANVFSGTGVVVSGGSQVNNIFTAGAGAEWDTTVPFNWGSGGVGASNLDSVVIYEAAA
jgi:hypothetical protein